MIRQFQYLIALLCVVSLSSIMNAEAQSSIYEYCTQTDNYQLDLTGVEANSETSGSVRLTALFTPAFNTNFCPEGANTYSFSLKGGPFNQTLYSGPLSTPSWTFDSSTLEPGAYTAKVIFNGVFTAYDTLSFTIIQDQSSPNVTISQPYQGLSVQGSIPFVATASDTSGVRDIQLFAGNRDLGVFSGDSASTLLNTKLFPDGILLLRARATDTLGNAAETSITITINNVDNAPEIAFLDIHDNQSVAGHITVRTGVFDEVGIDKVRFFVDGALISTDTVAPYDAIINTTEFNDGPHQIAAIATDLKGQETATELLLNFENGDTVAPYVQIDSPATGSTIKGTTTLIAQAYDESDISKVEFFIGSRLLGTATLEPFTIPFDTTQLVDGIYNFGVVAYDKAGNVATDDIVIIIQNGDKIDASVFITNPEENSILAGKVEVLAIAFDNIAIKEARLLVDQRIVATTKLTPYSFILDTTQFNDGAHQITVEVLDFAGNVGESFIPVRFSNSDPSQATVPQAGEPEVNPITNVLGLSEMVESQVGAVSKSSRQQTSKEDMQEHSLAIRDFMKDLTTTVRQNRKILRQNATTKRIPKLTKRANRKIKQVLKAKKKKAVTKRSRQALRAIGKLLKLLRKSATALGS